MPSSYALKEPSPSPRKRHEVFRTMDKRKQKMLARYRMRKPMPIGRTMLESHTSRCLRCSRYHQGAGRMKCLGQWPTGGEPCIMCKFSRLCGELRTTKHERNSEIDYTIIITEEHDHKQVPCRHCPVKDNCEHQQDEACCFGQYGKACNIPNGCTDQELCKAVSQNNNIVITEEIQ